MKKKVLCLILALAMVLPLLNLNVRAADQKFYTVYIDAGQGPVQEKAIVSDGELLEQNLTIAKKDKRWLKRVLEENRAQLQDTWLLTVDGANHVTFFRKEI